jgi:hypothetical protein
MCWSPNGIRRRSSEKKLGTNGLEWNIRASLMKKMVYRVQTLQGVPDSYKYKKDI